MKRFFIMLLVLVLGLGAALAEIQEVKTESNLKYLVETFDKDVPEELRAALAETAFAKDEVLCGATLAFINKKGAVWEHVGLLAVVHKDTRLLLSAQKRGESWRILPESEIFLRDDAEFAITAETAVVRESALNSSLRSEYAMLAVTYGQEAFLLKPTFGVQCYGDTAQAQWFELYGYQNLDDKGNGIAITCGAEGKEWTARRLQDGKAEELAKHFVRWPIRIEYIDGDDFPTTAEELTAWAEAHPVSREGNWVFAANLRTWPTTRSASKGQYIYTPVERLFNLGSWHLIRIGETLGWMSETYITWEGQPWPYNHYQCQIAAPGIARTKQEASLYQQPDGKVKQTLPAGTGLQILGVSEDWYHVHLPQGEVSWMVDGQGTYGYVRRTEAETFDSPLCMKYSAK